MAGRRRLARLRGDAGFTMVELLVAMTLLAVLGGVTTLAFISLSRANATGTKVQQQEASVLDALNRIGRDVSAGGTVLRAADGELVLQGADAEGRCTRSRYVVEGSELVEQHWTAPAATPRCSDTPYTSGALGVGGPVVRDLRTDTGERVFTYYDLQGRVLAGSPARTLASNSTRGISRIGLAVTARVDGAGSNVGYVSLATDASVRGLAAVGGEDGATPELPPCPTYGVARGGDGSPVVTWGEIAGATGYLVYRDGVQVAQLPSTGRGWTDGTYVSERNNSVVSYQVFAQTAEGVSESCAAAVYAPSGTATTLSGSVDPAGDWPTARPPTEPPAYVLTWSQVPGATGYKVYRQRLDPAPGSTATREPWTLAFVTNVPDRTTYTESGGFGAKAAWKVVTVAPGNDRTSNTVILATQPAAPELSVAVNPPNADGTSGGNTLSWTDAPGATSYRLYRVGTATPIYEGPLLTFTDPAALDSTTSYLVVARNDVGAGPASNEVSAQQYPDDADVLTFTAANAASSSNVVDGTNRVSWRPRPNATGYTVFRYQRPAANAEAVATLTLAQASCDASRCYWDDPGRSLGTAYRYFVGVRNAAGASRAIRTDGVPPTALAKNVRVFQRPTQPAMTKINPASSVDPDGAGPLPVGYEGETEDPRPVQNIGTQPANYVRLTWDDTTDENPAGDRFCDEVSCGYDLWQNGQQLLGQRQTAYDFAAGYFSGVVQDPGGVLRVRYLARNIDWGADVNLLVQACNPGGCNRVPVTSDPNDATCNGAGGVRYVCNVRTWPGPFSVSQGATETDGILWTDTSDNDNEDSFNPTYRPTTADNQSFRGVQWSSSAGAVNYTWARGAGTGEAVAPSYGRGAPPAPAAGGPTTSRATGPLPVDPGDRNYVYTVRAQGAQWPNGSRRVRAESRYVMVQPMHPQAVRVVQQCSGTYNAPGATYWRARLWTYPASAYALAQGIEQGRPDGTMSYQYNQPNYSSGAPHGSLVGVRQYAYNGGPFTELSNLVSKNSGTSISWRVANYRQSRADLNEVPSGSRLYSYGTGPSSWTGSAPAGEKAHYFGVVVGAGPWGGCSQPAWQDVTLTPGNYPETYPYTHLWCSQGMGHSCKTQSESSSSFLPPRAPN